MWEVDGNMVAYRDYDIAIIGIAGRFPEAENLDLFWQNLSQGKDSVRAFPPGRVAELQEIAGAVSADEFVQGGYLDSISYFDPEYFNISPEETRYIDPQQRLLLELVDEAVNDAGYGGRLYGRKVGIYMSAAKNQYTNMIDPTMPMAIANIPDSALAGRIAYIFNFTGPVMTIDTACSSSLTAIHCACQAIRAGECDYAVAGGAKMSIVPMGRGILQVLPILSKEERAKTFDKDADGTTFGEGGSVVLLKRLKQALADGDAIHAIIKASAVNSDGGRSNGLAAPNQDAQAEVISDVLNRAEVEADTIQYIEAHGTGTKLGDPIEVEGIARAFAKYTAKKQFVAISSLKTNIGHLDTAAGSAGLTKAVLALKHRAIPPSLHYQVPNPHIDFVNSPVYVNDQLTEWKSQGVRRAGVTSLGLTGTNVHFLLEEAPAVQEKAACIEQQGDEVITLSAKNEVSLRAAVSNLRHCLESDESLTLEDVAYTLNTGRSHFQYRFAFVAREREELVQKLYMVEERWSHAQEANCLVNSQPVAGGTIIGEDLVGDRVYSGVSKDLLRSTMLSPVFLFGDFYGADEVTGVELSGVARSFAESYVSCVQEGGNDKQTRLFALQYAYVKLLNSLGIEPNAVLGVGLGKSVSDVIQGKTPLHKGLAVAKECKSAVGLIDPTRLYNVLQQMIKDGHNFFVILENKTRLGNQVKELLADQEGVFCVALDQTSDVFYRSLCELYTRGISLRWDGLYEGDGRYRVHLPTYAYHRRSLLIQPQALKGRRRMTPSELDLAGALDDPMNGLPLKPITADDLLEMFQSVTGTTLDLDADFTDNGTDSIMVMQAAGLIKRQYQVTIPMDLFYTATSVRELVDRLVELINARLIERGDEVMEEAPSISDSNLLAVFGMGAVEEEGTKGVSEMKASSVTDMTDGERATGNHADGAVGGVEGNEDGMIGSAVESSGNGTIGSTVESNGSGTISSAVESKVGGKVGGTVEISVSNPIDSTIESSVSSKVGSTVESCVGGTASSTAESNVNGTVENTIGNMGNEAESTNDTAIATSMQRTTSDFNASDRGEKTSDDRYLPVITPEEMETLTVTAEVPEQVLLTGATGFLGAHLIRELMNQTNAQIYCIARGETLDLAYARVQEKLQYYFGAEFDPQMGQRIRVVKGDLTEPYLGMGQNQYDESAEQIDTIIHTAADVRHQGKYSVFERNNVFTTRQLLEFAFHKRMKVFHHSSTFGVAGWNPEYRMYGEQDFNTGQTFPQMPYGRSKFEAEKLIYEARKQGLRSSVYRVGNLSGRFSDGLFQPNIESNEVYGYIKSIVLLGQIPSGIRKGFYEITPVDLTSDAMVRLMRHPELVGYTYHLPYPRLVTFGELLDGLNQVGHRIAEVDFQKFYQHLTREVEKQSDSLELNLLLTSLRAANDRPQQGAPIRPLSVQSQLTRDLLAKVGFTWPEMGQDYLERMFKYCEAVGYFPQPGQKSVMGRLTRLLKR